MAMQIHEKHGTVRTLVQRKSCKEVKKRHHKQKRRELKDIDKPNPQYNRYSDGWVF